ncbi:MAG TPA: response regulator transcription factor [Lachnospiraceae bacterium]|nr:response regulator transcription factor [Lachnospiraceae bacterium]
MQTKILIVEDDADINQILSKIMKKQGFETVQAFSGSEARLLFTMEKNWKDAFDLVLLDLMLPGVMGEELIRMIREKSDIPIIVLSAKTALESRVNALNLGADDYLVKPFEKEEVIARVNGALRRYRGMNGKSDLSHLDKNGTGNSHDAGDSDQMRVTGAMEENNPQISYKELVLYPEAREVTVCGTSISLTTHEFEILLLLLQNSGKVFSRESLYEQIWQGGYFGEDNTVNVHVSNLRKKIAALDNQEYIKTVWGIGFKMA